MQQIAGKEDQPAGTVFKNVTLFKDMPAKDFLKKSLGAKKSNPFELWERPCSCRFELISLK